MKTSTLFVTLAIALFSLSGYAQPVIGGSNASANEFPWITGIAEKGETDLQFAQLCGASLIAPGWVLSAAHCVIDDYELPIDSALTINDLDVFLGVLQLSNPATGFERIAIAEIIAHPGYDPYTTENDIALLRLTSNSVQSPVVLPLAGDNTLYASGSTATVIGWGVDDTLSGTSADILQKAQVSVIASSTCNASSAYDGSITSNMFCAGAANGGTDACQGDSGGPLVVDDNGVWTQIGVVSWGIGCARPNFPGVYAKVSNYINWIESETGLVLGTDAPAEATMRVFRQENQIKIEMLQAQSNPVEVQLYDIAGRQVWNDEAQATKTFDVSGLHSGTYLLTVRSETEVQTLKFVQW